MQFACLARQHPALSIARGSNHCCSTISSFPASRHVAALAAPCCNHEPLLRLLLRRLPLDSAKKLRWYDKSDVASLTRQHVREKHLLLDTITALKKVGQHNTHIHTPITQARMSSCKLPCTAACTIQAVADIIRGLFLAPSLDAYLDTLCARPSGYVLLHQLGSLHAIAWVGVLSRASCKHPRLAALFPPLSLHCRR